MSCAIEFAKNPKGLNVNNPRCNRGARIGQFATNLKSLNSNVLWIIITFKPFGFVASVPAHYPPIASRVIHIQTLRVCSKCACTLPPIASRVTHIQTLRVCSKH